MLHDSSLYRPSSIPALSQAANLKKKNFHFKFKDVKVLLDIVRDGDNCRVKSKCLGMLGERKLYFTSMAYGELSPTFITAHRLVSHIS